MDRLLEGETETPQSIIYEAWKNTEKPIIYETSDAKGNPVLIFYLCLFSSRTTHKFPRRSLCITLTF